MQIEFTEMLAHLQILREKFVDKHITDDPTLPVSIYDVDVRCYCVLAHAAMEQFFEELAEYAMKTILNQWLDPNAKTFSKMQVLSLLCLIGSTDKWKIDVISDEAKPQHKPLHQVASHLQEQEKKFLLALGDNNGASLKYLRALFTPLGIAIEIDPAESSALDRLARSRGFAAHRRTSPTAGRYMYKAVGPEDALKDVEACVAYCGKLLNELPAPPSIP